MSLDGYVTGPNDSRENPFGDGAGMLREWFCSDAATDDDQAILQEMLDGPVRQAPLADNPRTHPGCHYPSDTHRLPRDPVSPDYQA